MNNSPAEDESEIELSELLTYLRRVVAKRKWIIFLLPLLLASIAALVVQSMTPVYRSTATLYIEPAKEKVVSIEEVYGGVSSNAEHLNTQLQIIKSRDMATKLVKRLRLVGSAVPIQYDGPTIMVDRLIPWRDWIPKGWIAEEAPLSDDDLVKNEINSVLSNSHVDWVKKSFLINVSFDSTSAKTAALMANTLADVYIENDLESRLQMTQKASSWLADRIKGLRSKLEASERVLQQFRDKEKLVDAKGVALGISGQLNVQASAMVAAHQKVAELENSYRQVQAILKGQSQATLDSIPAVLRSPSVIPRKTAEAEAERRLSELSNRYGANHPKIIAAESDLRAARENTRNMVNSVVSSITREYEVAKATEQAMQKSLDNSKMKIQDMSRKEFQLATLERDVQNNRQIYDLFVNRAKETGATQGLQSAVARVVDPAVITTHPIKPRKTLIVSMSLIGGLLLSIMLAVILDRLNNTIRNGEDVATKLEVPLLGFLPLVPGKHRNFEIQREILDNFDPAFSESVRTLRTGLLMSAIDNPHKVILVTSSFPEEGKTSVSMNLAFALAKLKRTCLIDADMRRPSIYKAMEADGNSAGLSNLVADTDPVAKCVHQHASGLFYIPSGPVPPNPSELLSSRRFADVMEKLESMFDVILIDSPPVQLVSDAKILASVANALVFVVRADSTPYKVAKGALDQLSNSKAQLLGVVLNRLDVAKAERYYGYGTHMSYGGKYEYYKSYGYYGGNKT